jgi:hypothetical protein
MLPLIIIILMYEKNRQLKIYGIWLVSFAVTLVLHLFLRIFFTGYIFGNYQQGAFGTTWASHIINFFKSVCRLFVLPIYSDSIFICCSLFIFTAFASLIIFSYKASSNKAQFRHTCLRYFIVIILSLSIPAFFDISMKTSESDRLLFWPSVFVVILISYVLPELPGNKILVFIYFILGGYFLTATFTGLSHWRKASSIITDVLNVSKTENGSKPIAILNLPDSYYGAYVFRNGFKEALILNKIDTAKIGYIAKFMIWDYNKTPDTLEPVCKNGQQFVDSYCTITQRGAAGNFLITVDNDSRYTDTSKESIWFWDKHVLKKLELNCAGTR